MFHPEYIDPKKLINNDDILLLFKTVEKHGGILRFVGGTVRDAIAGFPRADIDLVTDLSPSEFSDMCEDEGLRCVPIGIQFFTLGVIVNDSFFKITSLSSEEDSGQDEWKKDASLRDLTINAVYADEKGNVFDYYSGISDLEKGVIKFIGKPQETIERDYIRIMRFFRFCAMFGKKIDKKSLKSCIENKELLHHVSSEKIKEELFKVMMAPYAARALELIFKYGVLDFLIAPPKHIDNISKLDNLVTYLNLDKSILRRIFVLFEPTERRIDRLSNIFRLTKNQKDYLLSLCRAKVTNKCFKDNVLLKQIIYKYGKDACLDLFLYLNLNNENFEDIKETVEEIHKINIPDFPISGRDLVNIGADKKYIGLYLDVLKKEWFESSCTLSQKDLIQKYEETFKYSV